MKENDRHFYTAHGYTRGAENFDVSDTFGGRRKIPLDEEPTRGSSSWVEDEPIAEWFTEEYLDELVRG